MSRALSLSTRARSIEPTLIRSLRAGLKASTIDFGLGQTDLNVTEAVREDLLERLKEPIRAPYTPNAGIAEAREAVARHVGLTADEVLLTCGVQEALAVTILGLCDPGDEVLVPDPGFPAYANLVRAAGAEPVGYPLGAPTSEGESWELDVEAILGCLGEKTRLVIFNNPSNPTGSVHGVAQLREVLSELAAKEIAWISDEIYEDYIWRGEFMPARRVEGAGPGLTLSGLSKSHHMMGWRLGWILGPMTTLKELTPLHQHLVTCAPLPAQMAAIAALTDHDSALQATLKEFGDRRARAIEAFEGLGVCGPESAGGAFYLFLDVRPWLEKFGTTSKMAEAILAEEDVMVIPGEGFGSSGLGHLRVAYTIGGDRFEIGLQRLRRFLERH